MVDEKKIKLGQKMYIMQASFEYLISLLMAGSFLAKLTGALGMRDSLTGILTSVASLGCLFGLLSIGIRKRRVKKLVIILCTVDQLLFGFLYIIPLLPLSGSIKIGLFVVCMVGAYVAANVANPKKINWLMSLVDDRKRGIFTANKEIISLILGMAFSYGMGSVMDHYEGLGEIATGFKITAAVIFFLMICHLFTLIFTVEKELPEPEKEKSSIKETLKALMKNKGVRDVTLVFSLYYISCYFTSPFLGTYQNNELGFSLKYVAILGIVNAVVRVMVSKAMGNYADRKSYPAMLEICLWMTAFAFASSMLSVPGSGTYVFAFHYIFAGIGAGGISNALTSMVFNYVTPDERADALAITLAVSGTAGFISTLTASPLVSFIQNNGNRIFGLKVYAQQFNSVISIFLQLMAIFYLRKTLRSEERKTT